MYRNELTFGEKLGGSFALEAQRASVIKQTYGLLSLAVIAAIVGGHIGATTPAIVSFFSGFVGWIVAMILLNVLPHVAMGARNNPVLGIGALILDGFVAGLILAPILFLASRIAPDVVLTAMIITAIIFFSVTGYVLTSGKTFSAPKGLMTGIFFSVIGLVLLNVFMQTTILSLLIAGAIGIFGLFVLIFATSEVLNNPEADSPIPGALMLFAGLFNVFVAVLHILLAFAGDRD